MQLVAGNGKGHHLAFLKVVAKTVLSGVDDLDHVGFVVFLVFAFPHDFGVFRHKAVRLLHLLLQQNYCLGFRSSLAAYQAANQHDKTQQKAIDDGCFSSYLKFFYSHQKQKHRACRCCHPFATCHRQGGRAPRAVAFVHLVVFQGGKGGP